MEVGVEPIFEISVVKMGVDLKWSNIKHMFAENYQMYEVFNSINLKENVDNISI